jgi:hypothetical protein
MCHHHLDDVACLLTCQVVFTIRGRNDLRAGDVALSSSLMCAVVVGGVRTMWLLAPVVMQWKWVVAMDSGG